VSDWEQPIVADAPQPEPYPFWGYRDLIFLIGLAVPCLVIGILFVSAAAIVAPESWNTPAVAALTLQFLIYGLWFGCLWGLIRLRYDRPFGESLRWKKPSRGWASYVLLGLGLAVVVGLLGAVTRAPNIEMPMKELLSDRTSLLLVGIFAVSLGPVCEELIFRGFLQPLIERSLGPVLAVVLSALPFALLHGPQYAWSWQHILLVMAAGCVFGVVRILSGSTAAAAAMHAGYNLTFFVAYLSQWDQFTN